MLSSKEAQFPLACFSNTYSSLIQCFLNTYSSLNSQYTSICFQILFRSEVQAIPSQIKVWIGSQLLSAVETFEICLKSETSLVSFLPTTLFTPARDLHRTWVPEIPLRLHHSVRCIAGCMHLHLLATFDIRYRFDLTARGDFDV